MLREYAQGDADAAVAFFSRQGRASGSSPAAFDFVDVLGPIISVRSVLLPWLLTTEVAMARGTFGKYAMSAPLQSAKGVVGLNGMFEIGSFTLHRSIDDALHLARGEPPPRHQDLTAQPGNVTRQWQLGEPERVVLETFVRDWHVVTVSHCQRWALDCADALLASARRDFADDPEILALAGAMAETRDDAMAAELLWRQALVARPSLVDARLRLGRRILATGQIDGARREFDRALTDARDQGHTSGTFYALTALAEVERRAGRAAAARTYQTEADRLRPFSHALFAGLGVTAIYRAALFHEQRARILRLRALVRP